MSGCSFQSEEFVTAVDQAISQNSIIQKMARSIDALESNADKSNYRLSKLENRVAKLESDVAVLKSDVAVLKADMAIVKNDIQRLNTSVHELGLKIETLQSTVELALEHVFTRNEKKSRKRELEPRVVKVESDVSVLNTAFKNHIRDPKAHH